MAADAVPYRASLLLCFPVQHLKGADPGLLLLSSPIQHSSFTDVYALQNLTLPKVSTISLYLSTFSAKVVVPSFRSRKWNSSFSRKTT